MSRQTPDYGLDCGRAVRAMFIVGVTAVIGIQAHKTLHQVVLTRVCACLVDGAVWCELLSDVKFPDQLGKYREFLRFRRDPTELRCEKARTHLSFFAKFPTQPNRELFRRNREFNLPIREFSGPSREKNLIGSAAPKSLLFPSMRMGFRDGTRSRYRASARRSRLGRSPDFYALVATSPTNPDPPPR